MTASAILIGAVIIGSCLLCTTDMEPKLFGARYWHDRLSGRYFSAAVCGITHFFRKMADGNSPIAHFFAQNETIFR